MVLIFSVGLVFGFCTIVHDTGVVFPCWEMWPHVIVGGMIFNDCQGQEATILSFVKRLVLVFFFFLSLSWFSFHIQWNAHLLSYFNLFNRENCLARKECEGKRMVWDLVKFFCDKRMCWNVVYIVVQNVILIDFPHILFVIFWNGIQLSIKQICMNSRQLQNHSVSVLTLHVSRSTCYTYVLL